MSDYECFKCAKPMSVQELADWDQTANSLTRLEAARVRKAVPGIHFLGMIGLCKSCFKGALACFTHDPETYQLGSY